MTEPEQIETVRRIAAFELDRTSESRRTIIEEHSAAFRWLIASLLAVNGGAIVFAKELIVKGDSTALYAAGSFLVGVMSALLTGWFSQKANRLLLEPLAEASSLWIEGIESGHLNEERFSEITEKMGKAVKSAWPTQFCGWISALSFMIGAIALGASLAA